MKPFSQWNFKERTCPCGKSFVLRSGSHKWCDECRESARNRPHPGRRAYKRSPEKNLHYSQIHIARRDSYAAKVNEAAASGMTANFSGHPDFEWFVVMRFPFSYAASKNTRTKFGRGHAYTSGGTRQFMNVLALHIKKHLAGRKIVTGKLWIDIFVQKPNHMGDAMNVVDVISDAIQIATGLNDRWYCLRRLDWEVKKKDPEIFIGLGQEHLDERGMCSGCGLIKPIAEFQTRKTTARYCATCRMPPKTIAAAPMQDPSQ